METEARPAGELGLYTNESSIDRFKVALPFAEAGFVISGNRVR